MSTHTLEVHRLLGEVREVTLWETWQGEEGPGVRRVWSWVRPPSVREALAEGRRRCREIFGVVPVVRGGGK